MEDWEGGDFEEAVPPDPGCGNSTVPRIRLCAFSESGHRVGVSGAFQDLQGGALLREYTNKSLYYNIGDESGSSLLNKLCRSSVESPGIGDLLQEQWYLLHGVGIK